MKHLVLGLTFGALALAQHPNVSECFKVHNMIRADEAHYWTTWTNACPYTIDSVYVMVRFADRSAKEVADGVWSLHFIAPGAHRTMRFSAPGKLPDFASVRQQKITGDMGEAFGRPPSSLEMAAVSAYKEVLAKDEGSGPRVATVSTIVTDAGEEIYRTQAVSPDATFRTDFPDPWRAVLSPEEAAVSHSPRASFVRFVSDEKPLFQ
ncbi:MAG: hypothetical protein ABSF12_21720 [Bryobacteraceae bacterium]|jgi:hypothetical protein